LYWWPEYLGFHKEGNTGMVGFFDPVSRMLSGKAASQWFMYGLLYTLAILLLGVKFIVKYRHSRYQVIRTISIMFFQTIIAFLLPEILSSLNLPYNDFKNMWPLNYYFFDGWHIDELLKSGGFGMFVLVWGILLAVVISPFLTYFFGKRWYCSWVCGCGGLAETAGDSFRQLSDKSTKAWKIERYLIYSVLVFVVVMTAMVIYTYFTGKSQVLFLDSFKVREWYGFLIGAAFSGVVGVGFYPLMGSRVWCRFGCPMAAILGIQQKFFSRFRITTNGGQCISCGNCSTYCEMGIDVRAYAQRGQDIIRASCVGCGVCSSVCPRGVLKLENGPQKPVSWMGQCSMWMGSLKLIS
jgi:polyferredoxin